MRTIETNSSDEVAMTSVEEFPVSENAGNYDGVRFNALKHGILSRLTVLPHESAEEFSELLAGLMAEHRPTGITEQHLVEELAAIIWRKRRVLQAEGATINRGLRRAAQSSFDSPIPAAALSSEDYGKRASISRT